MGQTQKCNPLKQRGVNLLDVARELHIRFWHNLISLIEALICFTRVHSCKQSPSIKAINLSGEVQ